MKIFMNLYIHLKIQTGDQRIVTRLFNLTNPELLPNLKHTLEIIKSVLNKNCRHIT